MEKWLVQGTYKMSGAWGNIQVSVSEHGGSQREHGNSGLLSVSDRLRPARRQGRPPGRCPGLLVTGSDILGRCLHYSYGFGFHEYIVIVEKRGSPRGSL